MDNARDFFLKLTSKAGAKSLLTTMKLEDLMHREEDGTLTIDHVDNKHVAIRYFPTIVLVPGVYDFTDPENPVEITPPVTDAHYLMVRVKTRAAMDFLKKAFWEADPQIDPDTGEEILVRKGLPPGVEVVDSPTTQVWL